MVGYDNVAYSAHLNPPLTTVAQNPYAIGSSGVPDAGGHAWNGVRPETVNI